jgi:hypothetical protein
MPRSRQRVTTSRYAAFDVVVVPFPNADRLAEKRRLALVIQPQAPCAGRDLAGNDHQYQ